MGLETEYAFAAWSVLEGSRAPDRGELLRELFSIARSRFDCIAAGRGADMYLSNGSRFYLDGGHPEWSTPECGSPGELGRWTLAGERMLAELALEVEARHPGLTVSLSRVGVDYARRSAETWGCHENYLFSGSRREIGAQVLSHLVSRIVFTGAGGFDNLDGSRRFLISPRVPHMKQAAIWSPSTSRALISDRNEPLSADFHRLHLLCGESLCSQLGSYLRAGTSALVVRLAEAGLCNGGELAFQDPLGAMLKFSRDVRCRERVPLAAGRRVTAIEVQRSYLENAERQLDSEVMPEWAPEVCRRWREVLDHLEDDPESLGTRLDWVTKLVTFRKHARAARSADIVGRPQLAEIDTRFGQLGERSIFAALEQAGALDHELPEVGLPEVALREPPAGGRAEARGHAIRELGDSRRYVCSWDRIVDPERRRVLEMDDPFDPSPRWRKLDRRESGRQSAGATRLARAIVHYNAHRSAQAARMLRRCVREARVGTESEGETRFWYASTLHDMGLVDEAIGALEPALPTTRRGASEKIAALVWTRYCLLLIEGPARLSRITDCLAAAESICDEGGPDLGRSRLGLLQARLLDARGQHREAIEQMEIALQESRSDPIAFSSSSYLRWLLEFCVRAGDLPEALSALERWSSLARERRNDVSRATAASELYLAQGRPDEAWRAASLALRESTTLRRHRSRVEACCAYVRAGVATGQLEKARKRVPELLRWRHTGLGALRYQVRATHLVYAASVARSQPLASSPKYSSIWRTAARQVEMLDSRLESTHRRQDLMRLRRSQVGRQRSSSRRAV